MNTVHYGRGGRGYSLSDGEWLQRSIFMRDHDHLIVPHRYTAAERKIYDDALLRRQFDKVPQTNGANQ